MFFAHFFNYVIISFFRNFASPWNVIIQCTLPPLQTHIKALKSGLSQHLCIFLALWLFWSKIPKFWVHRTHFTHKEFFLLWELHENLNVGGIFFFFSFSSLTILGNFTEFCAFFYELCNLWVCDQFLGCKIQDQCY